MSRQDTVKPESYPDAAGVNPAGTPGKRRGSPWEASGPVRSIRTTRNFLVRGDRPDDSVVAGLREGMTDQLSLFGERAAVRPLGGGEAGSRSAPTGGAASVVVGGRESSPGDGYSDGEDL